jgi:hypothetical protein
MLQCIVDQIRTLRKGGDPMPKLRLCMVSNRQAAFGYGRARVCEWQLLFGTCPVITHDFDESLLALEIPEYV